MTSTVTLPALIYEIDNRDRFVAIQDPPWGPFAAENGADAKLQPSFMIGQLLWDYISEPTLRQIYQRMLTSIRSSLKTVKFSYRCDSPAFRRFMQMAIFPNEDGHVRFESQTINVEHREEHLRVMSAFTGRTFLRCCSVCNLFRSKAGNWLELEQVVQADHVLDVDHTPSIAWTVCTNCRNRLNDLTDEAR